MIEVINSTGLVDSAGTYFPLSIKLHEGDLSVPGSASHQKALELAVKTGIKLDQLLRDLRRNGSAGDLSWHQV